MTLKRMGMAWTTIGFLAVALLRPAAAENVTYSLSIKGTSRTLAGQEFKFTGTGTMTVDDQTGAVTFNANLSNGTSLQGNGTAGANPKIFFAKIDFTQGPATGVALIDGKVKRQGAKITGKFNVGIPDRLGPAPGGFVYTTGTLTGIRQ